MPTQNHCLNIVFTLTKAWLRHGAHYYSTNSQELRYSACLFSITCSHIPLAREGRGGVARCWGEGEWQGADKSWDQAALQHSNPPVRNHPPWERQILPTRAWSVLRLVRTTGSASTLCQESISPAVNRLTLKMGGCGASDAFHYTLHITTHTGSSSGIYWV